MNTQLKLFVGIAQSGSFAKAAEKLYLTAPALMNQIDKLEYRIGCRLFERSNRGLKLTAAGLSFYEDAVKLIEQTDKAMIKARKISEQDPFTISIGSSLLNPYMPFMELFYKVAKVHPEYKLRVVSFDDDRRGILNVLDRIGVNFDLLLGCAGSKDWTDKCNFLKLGEKKIYMAVPKQNPLSQKEAVTIDELDHQRIMLMNTSRSDNNNRMLAYMHKHCPNSIFFDAPPFYDMNVFLDADEKQCILAILENWSEVHPNFKMVKVDWDFAIPYGILYSRTPSRHIEEFIKYIINTK